MDASYTLATVAEVGGAGASSESAAAGTGVGGSGGNRTILQRAVPPRVMRSMQRDLGSLAGNPASAGLFTRTTEQLAVPLPLWCCSSSENKVLGTTMNG